MNIKKFFNDVRFLWLVLAIPAIVMSVALVKGAESDLLIHVTGEFAARLLILAMLLSLI